MLEVCFSAHPNIQYRAVFSFDRNVQASISCQKFHKYAIKKCVAYQRKTSLCEISAHFFYAEKGGFSLKWQKATR